MRKILTIILALFFIQNNLLAQPTGDVFPDFTVTDIDGNTHNLQSYLDDGKIVMVDVFATWCSVCIASLPAVDAIYEEHGPNGDNSLVILSFEKDANTSNEAAFVANNNVPYPVIADGLAEIATWNTIGQPNFFVICSDGSFDYHIGGVTSNTSVLTDKIDACAALATGVNNYDQNLNLAFYSNPVEDQLVFELSKAQRISYSIFDLSGKTIIKGQSNTSNNTIDVTSLERGIYFLQIIGDNQANVTKKIIKN
jgi:thiol-disulfide isomerase/thioredoxin